MSSEFDNILENEFFVIDSNNLNVETKLYGFIITENAIITDKDVPLDKKYDEMGGSSYVYILNKGDELIIKQDVWGSYGLYLFKKENYFAISNSFLKLVEYIKESYPLTMNFNYANAFLPADLCSIAYKETLINEIEILPRHIEVTINKIQKKLKFNFLDYQEKTIDLDSKEGMEILDAWFYKWINFIRFLKKNTNNILVDLSGGFDTRVILTLILNSNIDLNLIKFNSIQGNTHGHSEDYEIASEISKGFDFKLNQGRIDTEQDVFSDLDTTLNISLYAKLGFHKQMHFTFSKATKPLFSIGGNGNIRDYPNQYTNDFLKKFIERAYNFSDETYKDTEILLKNTLKFIEKEFNVKDYYSKELPEIHYRETRNRYHNARVAIESFISNKFEISPLLDYNLYKLNVVSEEHKDDQALIATIFLRYCPEVLNFPFEGKRFIKKETIALAKKLNEKYPFIRKDYEFISEPENYTLNLDYNPDSINRKKCNFNEPRELIKKIFLSKSFKHRYISLFPQKTYYEMVNDIKTKDHYPLSNALTAVSIIRVLNCIEYSQTKLYDSENLFLKNFLSVREFEEYNIDSNFIESISNSWLKNIITVDKDDITLDLDKINKFEKYVTARIDIKNRGLEKNDIIIENISDKDSFISSPNWFKDENGWGKVILSKNGELSFKIKCKHDGILDLSLRGVDFRDSSNNRIPIYIKYKYFEINNEVIFNDEEITSHDKFYKFSKEIKDNQELSVKIKWSSL